MDILCRSSGLSSLRSCRVSSFYTDIVSFLLDSSSTTVKLGMGWTVQTGPEEVYRRLLFVIVLPVILHFVVRVE